ncbi:sugar ABC transporter permease (plasmid) [Halorientalis sp. IM1011]|uniref:carbohydrate ABC transporter permease n=1 Tax=Halorientalis sp. IM1011 TaxID=1932360 RepID=UPI00097CC9D8|nr:sugar ABC transporter permease [Halorientalis sp. IM1011]AQL44675.1 sugar ABC transporter permease [Halorientalis sp. IM1011]
MSISNHTGYQRIRDGAFSALSNKWVLISLTVLPVLALFTLVIVIPVIWTIWSGFHEIPIFSPSWQWVGIDHYLSLASNEGFQQALFRSSVFAGGSVAFQLVTGTLLALALNRSFKYVGLVRAIAMLPYLIPTAVLGFIGLWMGNSQWGIINSLLMRVGIINESIAWYGNPDVAMVAVILTSSWKFTIFVTIMVLARLQSIPDGYYEAAQMSGATAYQRFRDITLPNLKGVIFIVVLLRGIWMFNKFDIIWVLTEGGPGSSTTTAPIYVYQVAFNSTNLGEAAALSTALFGMLVVGAILYFYVLSPEEEVRVE